MKKILFSIIFFYFLALFQTSFLIHFNIWGIIPNLVLIAAILVNIFEEARDYSGIFSSAAAGFFLDIFSENFIGFWTLILVVLSFFIKFILKKYIRLVVKT